MSKDRKRRRKAGKQAAEKAKAEAKKEEKEEANKELPKAEPAHEEARDLQAEWDSGNTDSEGEYASLSSTECNDPEPTFLKPTAKQKAVRPKPTAKTSSRLRLKSVQRNPIRLRSAVRLRSVAKGIRPERHPFVKLINLKGKVGPRYSRPVSHQPTTTRRPGCIDSETGIEHRLSDSGRWLPVLGTSHRTGKPRSKASKYKQKEERKAKAIARKKSTSTQRSSQVGLQRPPWREQASGSGSAGSKD